MADGTLLTWGSNDSSQLGNGAHGGKAFEPAPVTIDGHISSIACGDNATAAVTTDGLAYAWGSNEHGQVGDGAPNAVWSPEALSAPGAVKQVSLGHSDTLLLLQSGQVVAIGDNSHGQLGSLDLSETSVPTEVPLPTSDVVSVASAQDANYAITSGGVLYSWGSNVDGQLGRGGAPQGSDATPGVVQFPTQVHVTSIATHVGIVVALDDQGRLWAWGSNYGGYTGTGDANDIVPTPERVKLPSNAQVVRIAGGPPFLAIQADGKAWVWGATDLGDPTEPQRFDVPNGDKIVQAAGSSLLLVQTKDGSTFGVPDIALGGDPDGQLGDGKLDHEPSDPLIRPLHNLDHIQLGLLCLGAFHGAAVVGHSDPTSAATTTSVPIAPSGASSGLRLDGVGRARIGMTADQATAAGIAVGAPDSGACRTAQVAAGSGSATAYFVDDHLAAIEISAGPIKTDAGIGIGSTGEQIQEAYVGHVTATDLNGPVMIYRRSTSGSSDNEIAFSMDGTASSAKVIDILVGPPSAVEAELCG